MGRKPVWVEVQYQEFEKERKAKEKAERDAYVRRINKYNSRQIIKMLLSGELKSGFADHLHNSRSDKRSWGEISNRLSDTKSRFIRFKDNYIKILTKISSESTNFFDDYDNARSLSSIAEYLDQSIRDIEDWTQRSRSIKNQLHHLLRFLFCKYNPPTFLDKGFATGDMASIELFLHIGAGKSLKKFPLVPSIKLNNKIYHYLLDTPEVDNYFQAFRRAQMLSMGADKNLCETLMGSQISNDVTERQDEFWTTVIQFFINHPMVEPSKVREMVDYINSEKYQSRNQPNFTMKGRTPEALMRQSDEWHERQAEARRQIERGRNRFAFANSYKAAPEKWEKNRNILDGNYTVGKKDYKIVQLFTRDALQNEGTTMRHCVGSYATSCSTGNCTIFSLRDDTTSYVTIEVRGYQIVQMQGKCAAPISDLQMSLINRWVISNNLSMSSRYSRR